MLKASDMRVSWMKRKNNVWVMENINIRFYIAILGSLQDGSTPVFQHAVKGILQPTG